MSIFKNIPGFIFPQDERDFKSVLEYALFTFPLKADLTDDGAVQLQIINSDGYLICSVNFVFSFKQVFNHILLKIERGRRAIREFHVVVA